MASVDPDGVLGRAIESTVRMQVRAALARHDGDRTRAAAFLGVSRRYIAEVIARDREIAREFPPSPGRPKKSAEGG